MMIKPVNPKQTEKHSGKNEKTDVPKSGGPWREKLARNLALTGLLALTIVTIKNQSLPSESAVWTAMQEIIDPNWDAQLGKISFVSSLFPETVSVFWDSGIRAELTAPCFGSLTHPWTEQEPYLCYQSLDQKVYAIAPGQVMSVSNGIDAERVLRIRQDDGLETLYYELGSAAVREGDHVSADTYLGSALPNKAVTIEVRRAGRAIDPTESMLPRKEALP